MRSVLLRLLAQHDAVLDLMSVGFEILEVASLAGSPFGDIVHSAVHAREVAPH